MTGPAYKQHSQVNLDWWDTAACATVPKEVFFPKQGGSLQAAKQICATCPHTGTDGPCYQLATSNGETRGIWGGVSFGRYHQIANPTRVTIGADVIAHAKRLRTENMSWREIAPIVGWTQQGIHGAVQRYDATEQQVAT